MKCTNCGNRLSPGSSVCAVCGAPTAAQTPPVPGLQGSPQGAEGAQPGNGSASQPRRPQTAFYGRYDMRGNAVLPAPSSLAIPTPSASPESAASVTSPILAADPIAEP